MSATEWRTQVAQMRVRIPDLVLVKIGPQPDVFSDPPVLVVEIISPDDTFADTQERAADFQSMGAGTVWIIDPRTRTGRQCVDDIWTTAKTLRVPGTEIHADLNSLFKQLDPFRF